MRLLFMSLMLTLQINTVKVHQIADEFMNLRM